MERRRESDTPDVYSKVYAAERPEIFFKATPDRCMGPFESDRHPRRTPNGTSPNRSSRSSSTRGRSSATPPATT